MVTQALIYSLETKLILYYHIVEVEHSLLAPLLWDFEWEFKKKKKNPIILGSRETNPSWLEFLQAKLPSLDGLGYFEGLPLSSMVPPCGKDYSNNACS